MGRLRLRVAVVAIVAVIAGVVGVSAPASAASIGISTVGLTIDCTTLHSGYYQSLHVTTRFWGMTAGAQYTGDVQVTSPQATIAFAAPVVADTRGYGTVDTTATGTFVSGGAAVIELYSGGTQVLSQQVGLGSCASGVTVTGSLTAEAVCPTRYLTDFGQEQATTRHVHGTLTGFVPAEPYTFTFSQSSPLTTVSGVADATGAVQLDFMSDNLEASTYAGVYTTSQAQGVASADIVQTDPCPAMRTKYPAPASTSDIQGDGLSDLVAIDFSGRLLYYENDSWLRISGLPFTTSLVIGSGWGPQYGIRMQSMGDMTGDGYADLVAVRSDGSLVAYYNNIKSNPGHMPFTSGTVIGSGWQGFTSITLGDVNGDGFADLIARKADGTVWLYLNHFLSNPRHLPFSTGVPMTIPGLGLTDSFVAADVNRDGYADIVSSAGWTSLNRAPAGSPQMFIDAKGPQSGILNTLAADAPRAGWVAGVFNSWYIVTGVVIANPNGDGSLLYLEGLGYSGTAKVIGSGWQTIRTIIS